MDDEETPFALMEGDLLDSNIGQASFNKKPWRLSSSRPSSSHWDSFKISSTSALTQVDHRQRCEKCCKSRKYFCYSCHIPLTMTRDIIPRVSLPIKVDIIKHPQEVDGKSTALHAKVISPDDVTIHTYPSVPEDLEHDGSVLLFPSAKAKTLDQLSASEVKRLVVIDSTWSQSKAIASDPKLQSLPQVRVSQSVQTLFWRPQRGKSDNCLATIEAIYYFCVEYHETLLHKPYEEGDYDNLLFLFKFMHDQINNDDV